MTAPETPPPSGPPRSSNEPLSTLRGAGVNYDARKVGRVVVGICLVALAFLVVLFTVAGFHKNSQINELHHEGVPVTVTVSHCFALMGGSGSNAAGYSCEGTFTVHGNRYTESLPGTAFHAIGSTLRAVVVPNDPALVSPVSVESSQHTSASVFLLPAILLVVLVLLVGLIVLLRRRRQDAAAPPTPGATS
jgi:NADH:ubiquinone oxidoreductase subunit 5 (subunit L)/multisubunit Na+/H+ antiporter MnhA subunit